jgi:endo-1,3(4)-beta-glucanase
MDVSSNRQQVEHLTSITWDPPRDLDTSCSDAVLQGLEYEVGLLDPSQAPVPGDFYYWGGTLAAQGRLALIAYDFRY